MEKHPTLSLTLLAFFLIFSSGAYAQEETSPDAAPTSAEMRVEAAIIAVREMPPVHERAEPWTVPVEELTLELQPLRKEVIEERLQVWLTLFQQELRKRIRIDIALTNSEDAEEQRILAARSAEQQAIVQALTERTEAVIGLLESRGVEVAEYRTFVAGASGQRLNFTDPAILYAQITSWLTSPEGGIGVGLAILQFVVVLIGFTIFARIVSSIIEKVMSRNAGTSKLLQDFIVGGSKRIIVIIGFVVALGAFGINMGPFLAIIGAAGLVVGLALQGTLSNFASGLLILFYRPFDVGDVIKAGGVSGVVNKMTLFTTRMLTFDNQVMLVPNNEIWNNVITNATALDKRRVDLTFGIAYADDMDKAVGLIKDVFSKHELILEDPAPTIKVHELGDNSVNIIARPWSKTSDYWSVYWDCTKQVKEAFDQNGISIPFPQTDIHFPEGVKMVTEAK